MLRNLLSGRYRSMDPGETMNGGSAPLFGTLLCRNTGASGTFDPNILITPTGTAPTWDVGDGTQYPTTLAISHTYASAGDYEVRWDLAPEDLRITAFGTDLITSINTLATWVNLEQLNVSTNPGLGNVTMHKEWTKLNSISLNNTGCTALDNKAEFVLLSAINVDLNASLVTIPTFSAHTAMASMNCTDCTSLSTLTIYSAWTAFWFFWVPNCNFSAASIDAFLIALDGNGASNGNLKYENNPGSADGLRSGAATTAKANLVTKGWTITN